MPRCGSQFYGSKTGWKRDKFLVYKVEFQICSLKQSLIGLHKEVMSLSAMRTHSSDDNQQTSTPMTGQIFFPNVKNGVFNLISRFPNLKKFVKLHEVID